MMTATLMEQKEFSKGVAHSRVFDTYCLDTIFFHNHGQSQLCMDYETLVRLFDVPGSIF